MNTEPDYTNRPVEFEPEDAGQLAIKDALSEPKEFLPEIYKEAYNARQDPDARVSKVLAKCSALFVRLSDDQATVAQQNVELQKQITEWTGHIRWLNIVLLLVGSIQLIAALLSFAK